jgi:D-alanyl-D-alanine carboxypeptidase/D-alanyl-D-alanine-endopeptidase (penicillin-binding protein 4)
MRTGKSLLLAFFALRVAVAAELAGSGDLSSGQLRDQLAQHLSQARFSAATWGIKVISLESGKTIFETNAQKLLKPASNAKLFTGALALDRFGADYRIKTSVLAKSEPDSEGTLHGNLVIYGRGDFSLSARFHDGNYQDILEPMVEAIKKANIKQVEGDLVGDETYFRGPRMGSSWAWDDLQYYYGAEASALTLQDNVIDLAFKPGADVNSSSTFEQKPENDFLTFINRTRTSETNARAGITIYRPLRENVVYLSGSLPLNYGTWSDAVTVSDPALWFVTMLKETLSKEGIQVKGIAGANSWPEVKPTRTGEYKELSATESAPMSELVLRMVKPSQNLYAQLLLLQVGANSSEAVDENTTTEEAGLVELRKFLAKARIPANEVLLDEGSGLSRTALVTPNAIVELLKYMRSHKDSAVFRAALPEAGVDGTLRNRLPELKGNLVAKTGTIRYVNSLSGYMSSRAGEPLAFSIILNAYNNEGPGSSQEQLDAIPLLLARLNERTAAKATGEQ